MTHKCKVCGVTSDAAEFYAGVNTRCKECHKAKIRENRKANAGYYKTYDAYRYQNNPKRKAAAEKYRKTESGKAAARRSQEKWLLKNSEKRACHVILGNAVRDGRVFKPDKCEACGATDCRIDGHHDDYAKPLEVKWVCRSCHMEIHRQEDERLATLHKSLDQFEPIKTTRAKKE
jgi:hypothetical protein